MIVTQIDPNSKGRFSTAPGAPQWHLHIPPETYGPYSLDQLRDYARDGRLTVDTLVWTEGADAWGRAADQAALKAMFPAAAPPAPPPPRQGPPSSIRDRAGAMTGDATERFATRSAAPADGGAMSFLEAAQTCLRLKYAGFEGRARRSEYWWFMLFATLAISVVYAVVFAIGYMMTSAEGTMPIVGFIVLVVLMGAVLLALIAPSVAVAVRRLHDLGWSGWWYLGQLIPFGSIVMIIAFMMRGNVGPNKYGPDPLADADF